MDMDPAALKLELGNRAKSIIADNLGLRENRSKKVLCPLHNDHDPSMSWFEAGLMWRCNSCEGKIDIYDYYMKYENMQFPEAVNKVAELVGKSAWTEPIKAKTVEYTLPKIETRPLSQPFVDYMDKRKISKETLDQWRVKESTWFNPNKGSKSDVYAFQYYAEDGKQLVYVSFRELGKDGEKGGCVPKTKPILWGMWHIDKTKPLVITEGQPDAMAVWQAGYKNVVSVPNGASNLKWIEMCWEWLQGIPEIIVFADNDVPGQRMAENIKTRLDNVKIVTSPTRKDANEMLYYEGPESITALIDEAINEMPYGLLDLAKIEYKTAMDEQCDGIETGFIEYDEHVEDWKPQELTVIFGRNNEGKTTFISQILAHCIQNETKTFLYSGEMSDKKIQNWLYRQLIGNQKEHYRTIITKYKDKMEPKPESIKQIKEWHDGKLIIFDRQAREVAGDLNKFFGLMELAARKLGVKLFVIDNLMSILEENADSLFSDQANLVQRCKDFAVKHRVHVVLLAHPNKGKTELKNAEVGNLEKTDISGSNNIPNKADNIIAVERNWAEDRTYDAIITSLKDRESGQRKVFKYYFSKNTLRFYNNRTSESKIYGWQKTVKQGEIELIEMPTPPDCPF